jgi:hypothetical protein
MARINKRLDHVKDEDLTGFSLIPAGVYMAQVTKTEILESRTGGAYCALRWALLEGDYANRFVFDRIILNGSDKGMDFGDKKLKAIARAIGHHNPNLVMDTEELEGRPCYIKVKVALKYETTDQFINEIDGLGYISFAAYNGMPGVYGQKPQGRPQTPPVMTGYPGQALPPMPNMPPVAFPQGPMAQAPPQAVPQAPPVVYPQAVPQAPPVAYAQAPQAPLPQAPSMPPMAVPITIPAQVMSQAPPMASPPPQAAQPEPTGSDISPIAAPPVAMEVSSPPQVAPSSPPPPPSAKSPKPKAGAKNQRSPFQVEPENFDEEPPF